MLASCHSTAASRPAMRHATDSAARACVSSVADGTVVEHDLEACPSRVAPGSAAARTHEANVAAHPQQEQAERPPADRLGRRSLVVRCVEYGRGDRDAGAARFDDRLLERVRHVEIHGQPAAVAHDAAPRRLPQERGQVGRGAGGRGHDGRRGIGVHEALVGRLQAGARVGHAARGVHLVVEDDLRAHLQAVGARAQREARAAVERRVPPQEVPGAAGSRRVAERPGPAAASRRRRVRAPPARCRSRG